jgi:hypothetical protein
MSNNTVENDEGDCKYIDDDNYNDEDNGDTDERPPYAPPSTQTVKHEGENEDNDDEDLD